MNLSRTTRLVMASALVATISLSAQEPKTEAGARAAVVSMIQRRQNSADSSRIVTDSVDLYRELRQCHDVANASPACTLIEGRVVVMATVRLTGAATAAVELRYYRVMRGSCPLGTPFPGPVISYTRTDQFTMGYADGQWKQVGSGRGMEC